jgi:hypothetical protein
MINGKTACAGKPPSLSRELWTSLVVVVVAYHAQYVGQLAWTIKLSEILLTNFDRN